MVDPLLTVSFSKSSGSARRFLDRACRHAARVLFARLPSPLPLRPLSLYRRGAGLAFRGYPWARCIPRERGIYRQRWKGEGGGKLETRGFAP